MKKKIVLLGCGQIGSRHLQAIVKLGGNLNIQVVEPNDASKKIGENRVREVLPKKHELRIEWLKDLSQVYKNADLTIVATTARNRVKIIDKFLRMGHKRFLIEKMVCQATKQYEYLLEALSKNQAKGWVNCTRRYNTFYSEAAGLFREKSPIIFNVIAGNSGLGCNAIHFLDLFSSFIADNQIIKLNGEYLLPKLLPNLRGKDLVEFAGTILGRTDNESFISITFFPYSDSSSMINVLAEDVKMFVDESCEKAFLSTRQNNFQWEQHNFENLNTSYLTTTIASEIIENNFCNLPTIEALYSIHKELFCVFNQLISSITGKRVSICPIT